MLPSLPVAEFLQPEPRSRAWNAVAKATALKPKVRLIGTWKTERYFRVDGRGGNRYVVVIWIDAGSEEPVAQCTCEAFYIPQNPTPCFHIASVLIWESEHEESPT